MALFNNNILLREYLEPEVENELTLHKGDIEEAGCYCQRVSCSTGRRSQRIAQNNTTVSLIVITIMHYTRHPIKKTTLSRP